MAKVKYTETGDVVVDKKIAQDITSTVNDYVQTALGEMGYQFEDIDDLKYDFPKIYKRLKAMGRNKPRDWQGWLADELYNDPTMVKDLAGDRIYDELYKAGVDTTDRKVFLAYARIVAASFSHLPGLTFDD